MESVDFLLGNVDKKGQLEDDEDLRELLDDSDGQVLRDYFAPGFDLGDLTKGSGSKANGDGPILPGDDAQDFSDEDSLAEDEDHPENQAEDEDMDELMREGIVKEEEQDEDRMSVDLFGPDMSSQPAGQHFGADTLIALLGNDTHDETGLSWSDEHQDGIFEELHLSPRAMTRPKPQEPVPISPGVDMIEEPVEPQRSAAELVKEWFPQFSRDEILRMTEIFGAKPAELNRPLSKVPRGMLTRRAILNAVCVPIRMNLEAERDERQMFKSHYPVKRPRQDYIRIKRRKLVHVERPQVEAVKVSTEAAKPEDLGYTDAELAFLTDDWENRITYDGLKPEKLSAKRFLSYINNDLVDGEWLQSISNLADIDSASREPPSMLQTKVLLNMNDQDILLEPTIHPRTAETSPRRRGGMLSKFNVSNDAAYDAMREHLQSRIRSGAAPLNIEHSGVALRLQHPFYKTKLSKVDARAFHRPSFTVKIDHEIRLSKMHSRKKKKDRGKDIASVLALSKDLSLSDNSTAVLMEFSEEYPPIMSNVGMGSKLINFYRKLGAGDETKPKLDIGETNTLDLVDKSPFGDYGHIDPGEISRVLYNKVIKAPIFNHEVNSNDFLLIRNHTRAGGPRYFLRQYRHLFVVGQTFPIVDVPSPHSRRALNTQKARLKMIVFRVLKRMRGEGKTEGLHVRHISRHFPDQNDLQIRARLKEFMDFKKSGPNQGHWELKFNEAIPDEEGIRSMVNPETVLLLDSMQAGARHLEDAGYSKMADDDEEESNLAIEQQLAPWIATRNFLDATQGKAMLKLNGEGDPTGVGEGFNFIKISMKGGFKPTNEPSTPAEPVEKGKEGRSYNVARQQKAYEEEITRIWNAQKASLSRTVPEADEDREYGESTADGLFDVRTPRPFDISAPSPAPSNADTLGDEDYLSEDSAMSSFTGNRVLRITRTIKTADGSMERKIETVTDPHVISAYVRKRKQIEAQAVLASRNADQMATEDGSEGGSNLDAHKRRLLEVELARLKRNRDRRVARQKQAANMSSIKGPPTPLGETPPSTGSPAPTPVAASKVKVPTFVPSPPPLPRNMFILQIDV